MLVIVMMTTTTIMMTKSTTLRMAAITDDIDDLSRIIVDYDYYDADMST